jgi:hypothetical protein
MKIGILGTFARSGLVMQAECFISQVFTKTSEAKDDMNIFIYEVKAEIYGTSDNINFSRFTRQVQGMRFLTLRETNKGKATFEF